MEANNFFFNSDKLVEDGISYSINNWGGTSDVTIQFELSNNKNNLLKSSTDISYHIDVDCHENVICALDSTEGVINQDELMDEFNLILTPQRAFDTGETVTVTVSATSESPYVKTLSATFNITVGKKGINYEIKDSAGSAVLNFIITNAGDNYIVRTAFGNYEAGTVISTDEYLSLSDENKLKCASALIKLTFDPTEIIIDSTSNFIKNAEKEYQTIDGTEYVKSITFSVEAMSSNSIRFYKKNRNENYTYPFENEESIIDFEPL